MLTIHFSSFFVNDPATTEIYTLSLHDALPIFGDREMVITAKSKARQSSPAFLALSSEKDNLVDAMASIIGQDRKSTRLNSSHMSISYAVFCLKKKNKLTTPARFHISKCSLHFK